MYNLVADFVFFVCQVTYINCREENIFYCRVIFVTLLVETFPFLHVVKQCRTQ